MMMMTQLLSCFSVKVGIRVFVLLIRVETVVLVNPRVTAATFTVATVLQAGSDRTANSVSSNLQLHCIAL